jgi:multiple sugar transport system ATP-binding protein
MADVQLEDVSRVHPDGTAAVDHVSLHVRHGELLALVGPSGCGKTTLLRLIAGLDPVSSGVITIGGRVVTNLPPHERNIAMVFEGDTLYPHLTIDGNLRFGLAIKHLPEQEVRDRVAAEARVLRLSRVLRRLPGKLSAGQRQRAAVGRATVRVPSVFLLDEPLTHLDAGERDRLRAELSMLLHGLGVTSIYVTHDQRQAMALGDRVAVMRGGVVEQVDRARVLYQRPANLFVAGFVGDPAMAFALASLEADGGGALVVLGGSRLRFPGVPSGLLRGRVGRRVVVGVRAEHLGDPARVPAGAAGQRLAGTVRRVERLGAEVLVHLEVDAPSAGPAPDGEDAPGDRCATLIARFPHGALVAVGEPLEVGVDMGGLSYFDPVSGTALWHGLA